MLFVFLEIIYDVLFFDDRMNEFVCKDIFILMRNFLKYFIV